MSHPRHRIFYRLLYACWGLCLSACSTLQPTPPIGNTDFQANQQALLSQKNWALKGRLNIKQDRKSDTVAMNWLQQNQGFDITLSGFAGIGSTRLYSSGNAVIVEKAGEKPVRLSSLAALSRNYLDFEFPAANLLYWVRGLPVPAIAATTAFDANSRLSTLVQQDNKGRDWILAYDRYVAIGNVVLPGRVRLSMDDLQLTFLVDEWQLSPSVP